MLLIQNTQKQQLKVIERVPHYNQQNNQQYNIYK